MNNTFVTHVAYHNNAARLIIRVFFISMYCNIIARLCSYLSQISFEFRRDQEKTIFEMEKMDLFTVVNYESKYNQDLLYI